MIVKESASGNSTAKGQESGGQELDKESDGQEIKGKHKKRNYEKSGDKGKHKSFYRSYMQVHMLF